MDPNVTPANAFPSAATATPRQGRPPVEAVDLDRANRPGVPKERPPQPWPNSRLEIEGMSAEPAVPSHGRPGKTMPPVYGTSVPPRGLSGAIRRAAYERPDHDVNHWTLLLLADRVDAWSGRARKLLWIAATGVALALVVRRIASERG
jgi:hypothetical protein